MHVWPVPSSLYHIFTCALRKNQLNIFCSFQYYRAANNEILYHSQIFNKYPVTRFAFLLFQRKLWTCAVIAYSCHTHEQSQNIEQSTELNAKQQCVLPHLPLMSYALCISLPFFIHCNTHAGYVAHLFAAVDDRLNAGSSLSIDLSQQPLSLSSAFQPANKAELVEAHLSRFQV